MYKSHNHIPELQSLRGIASLIVLLHHASFLFITTTQFRDWSELLLNAHAAVMLFFVLSGYVLVRSLSRQPLGSHVLFDFFVSRVFRIYPALWAACGLALLYLGLIHFRYPTPEASEWYATFFEHFPNRTEILRNILVAKWPSALVPPSWSIFIELQCSAFIPALVFANKRGAGLATFAIATTIALLAVKSGHFGTLIYLPSFSLGALIYRYKDFLKPMFRSSAMLILCLSGCYFFRRVNPAWRFDVGYNAFAPVLVESIFAAGVVLSAASRPIKILRGTYLAWLGDISYSLYLFHFILMSALAKYLGTASLPLNIRAIALMVGTLAVTLIAAHLSFEYIEKPGIAAGKKLMNLVTAPPSVRQ